jgi:hypothetical protein
MRAGEEQVWPRSSAAPTYWVCSPTLRTQDEGQSANFLVAVAALTMELLCVGCNLGFCILVLGQPLVGLS